MPRSSSNAERSPGGGGSASARRRKTASDSGAPCCRRRAGGLDEPLDDPAVGGGLAGQQVLGDALVRARLLGEQLGGTAVALCALGAGELRVDTAADDRMDERQRPAGLEDPRGRQQLGCVGCLGLIELRESRRLEKVALLEDRQRPSEPPARAPAADGAGGESSDRPFVRRFSRRGARPPRSERCRPSLSASTSSRTRNGVPRVARRQASTKTGSGALPSLDSTKLGDGGSRQRGEADHSAEGSVVTVASSSASVPASGGRVATTSAASSSSRRVSRKAR